MSHSTSRVGFARPIKAKIRQFPAAATTAALTPLLYSLEMLLAECRVWGY